MTDKYTSAWQSRLDETMQKILNREKFSYDLNADALYRQYKDMYTRQGRAAMEDTVGRAAALTGGYGNSYAQTAGQQTYQNYLQQLGDQVPRLQEAAQARYDAEGSRLQNDALLLMQQENADYSRYRDSKADRESAFDRLLTLITAYGYRPTEEEMAAAGMTQGHLNAIAGLGKKSSGTSGSVALADPETLELQLALNKVGANLKLDGIRGDLTDDAEKKYGHLIV